MRFFQSIGWRLQLWHGLLLGLVLAGFGFTAWDLRRTEQMRRIDGELEERIAVVVGALRRSTGIPNRPPPDRQPLDRQKRPPPEENRPPQKRPPAAERPAVANAAPPPEPRLFERELAVFQGGLGRQFYYVTWLADGKELLKSTNAPAGLARPERQGPPRDSRSRGTLRERFHFTPTDECVLVGRDIGADLAEGRHFGWVLMGAGALVLLAGLAGGWWISQHALRPIAEISATAAKISTGDLAQRIHSADQSSELGELVNVLNETFARLQDSFARQARFTADASHELRTPVSVVLTQTQTALARERPAVEYRESLEACQRAAQRMRRLTDSLLTLARLEANPKPVEFGACDLAQIAKEACDLVRPLADAQGISVALESAPALCRGNAEQLGQVVTNLLSNAVSYNRPGGSVRVRVLAEAPWVTLTVQDTGVGMAPEDLPHIFERFYRADKARSNAGGHCGLGLTIVKAIVEAHGGVIDVASERAQGSVFTVRLPALQPAAE